MELHGIALVCPHSSYSADSLGIFVGHFNLPIFVALDDLWNITLLSIWFLPPQKDFMHSLFSEKDEAEEGWR